MESIDAYELAEWQAFWEMEGGFGDMKQDFRTGQICSTLANVNRGKKQKAFKPEDFSMRPRRKDSRKDNTQVIIAGFEAIAANQKTKGKKK